jgi:hypothetical protein
LQGAVNESIVFNVNRIISSKPEGTNIFTISAVARSSHVNLDGAWTLERIVIN